MRIAQGNCQWINKKCRRRIPRVPLVIFLIASLGIAATGWWVYGKEKVRTRQAAMETLEAIADLKVGQIVEWRRERLADAATISQNPYNTLRIVPFPPQPGPGRCRRRHPGLAGVHPEKLFVL